MNFTFDASKTQAAAAAAAAATTVAEGSTTGAVSNFSFGGGGGVGGAGDAAKPLSTGFSLMSTPNQPKPAPLLGTALTSTPAPSTGLTFGIPSNTSTVAPGSTTDTANKWTGLPFGATATPTTAVSFGTTNTTSTTGYPAATPAPSTPGFGLGNATAAAAAAAAATTAAASTAGLTFGTPKPATTGGFALWGAKPAQTTGLTFGTPSTATSGTGFSLGSAASTTTAGQTGFSLTPATTTPQSQPTFGTSTTNTTASTGFALGGTGTTAASTGFSFGAGTTSSAAAPSSLAAPSTQVSLGTTTTVSSSTAATQPAAINFFQLEESINKWTLELEEQEKVFVNQATQVNAWDKLLITNGEKIVTLNQEVERVKIEQQQLEQELDYVVGQQKELQDCLVTLEKELASLSVSDPEREYTYRLAENLDTQLKQMSEDLKEIIEHLNEANRTQDSSDPIVQIGKILNAHMNSLQWLDQQTALLSQKIQQIDQMHQNFRQENERSFNLAYN